MDNLLMTMVIDSWRWLTVVIMDEYWWWLSVIIINDNGWSWIVINDDDMILINCLVDDDWLGRSGLMTTFTLILVTVIDWLIGWLIDWMIGDCLMTLMGGDCAVWLMMLFIDYDNNHSWWLTGYSWLRMVTHNDTYWWRFIMIDNVGSCMMIALLTDWLTDWLVNWWQCLPLFQLTAALNRPSGLLLCFLFIYSSLTPC